MSIRIERIRIDNYGPMRDQDFDLVPGLNLFFGANESGKTLLVEALLKLLLDGNVDDYDGIERVSGNPAGFLLFDVDGNDIQVPDATYADVFPDGTRGEDIRKAFVIRDADLRRPERRRDFGHSAYLRDVTDRIMGSQTRKIETVQERVADIANLANADSELLMDRKPVKLRSRRDQADALANDLQEYLEECREQDILARVRERRRMRGELQQVEDEISALERAETAERVETGRRLVWELRRIEAELEDTRQRSDEIEEYEELLDRIDSRRERGSMTDLDLRTYRNVGYVLAVLAAVSMMTSVGGSLAGMGVIANVVFPATSLVLLGALFIVGYRYVKTRREWVEERTLVREANALGFDGEDVESVGRGIEEEIDRFETTRRALSDRKSNTIGTLQGMFDGAHETPDAWEEALEAFGADVDSAERSYDEEELREAHQRRDDLEAEIERLDAELDAHRDRLARLDGRLRDIALEDHLDDVQDVRVRSAADLDETIRTLERFVDDVNVTRDVARSAIDIFEEIKQAEEREINRLFAEDDFIVRTFHDVTGGNYTDVWYEEGSAAIGVERADGRELTPDALSQGTYDLLYLVVRLKLARTLLQGDTGVLILDDAFVHSDSERTKSEIALLDRLASDGWQILYFSFRDVVKNAIDRCETGRMVELDRLEFNN